MGEIDIVQIQRILPHRYPFLLLDRVLEYEAGSHLLALKNVSANEPFFPGHFPGKPVMPGVLIIEALAQATAVLTAKSSDSCDNTYYLLAAIDNARFKRQVTPGDSLTLHVTLSKNRRNIYSFACRATVGEQLAASADIMCAAVRED